MAAIDVRSRTRSLEGVTLALRGRHQLENAAVAVALLDELARPGIAVPDEAVRAGLTRRSGRAARAVHARRRRHPARRRAQPGRRAGAGVSSAGDRLDARHAGVRRDARQGRRGACSRRSRRSARRSSARRRRRPRALAGSRARRRRRGPAGRDRVEAIARSSGRARARDGASGRPVVAAGSIFLDRSPA